MTSESEPKTTDVDPDTLEKLATEDPKSKAWNNPNSRKNLKQYQEKPPIVIPEIVSNADGEEEDPEADIQAEEITRGQKISPSLIKRLIPKRGVLTATEKKRYNGIVTVFLADFKNEEPTATDADDILEIALCDVIEMRLLDASKNDPGALVSVSQTLERIHKRKQAAKSNLANRRTDRKDSRVSQDLNIVDLVVRLDNEERRKYQERIDDLRQEEELAKKKLKDVLDKDGY
jgi:hypothetical protein